MSGHRTTHGFYDVLVWSLKHLSTGYFPFEDHLGVKFSPSYHPWRFDMRGKPIAGDFKGAFSEFRGDWKYLKEALMLQQYYNTHFICHLCRAHTCIHRNMYTDVRRDANWRRTLVDAFQWWIMMTAAVLVSPLLYIPGFHIYRVGFDIMHTLDLGIMQNCAASTLWELTESPADGGIFEGQGREQRFEAAFRDYCEWVKRNRLPDRAKRFKKGQWKKKGQKYPCISQSAMKAATLRSFQYWLFEMCCKEAATRTARGVMRAAMYRGFVSADEVMRKAGKFFRPEEKEEVGKHFEQALLCYHALSEESHRQGRYLYRWTPKNHALVHIYLDFFNINPRKTHCYQDEDMVGRMKRTYNGCHQNTAPLRSLQRYLIMVGLRWTAEILAIRLAAVGAH